MKKVVKNWKLRLFVLKPGSSYMEYFVDETVSLILIFQFNFILFFYKF